MTSHEHDVTSPTSGDVERFTEASCRIPHSSLTPLVNLETQTTLLMPIDAGAYVMIFSTRSRAKTYNVTMQYCSIRTFIRLKLLSNDCVCALFLANKTVI